jgi:hypothetical protein
VLAGFMKSILVNGSQVRPSIANGKLEIHGFSGSMEYLAPGRPYFCPILQKMSGNFAGEMSRRAWLGLIITAILRAAKTRHSPFYDG